jgi:zinc protease
MIKFTRNTLKNGLRILINEDHSTPLVAMNIIYEVGSRNEDPDLTGMAHLFEHLMFGGSKNIPDFDTPLQLSGAENNAFTNSDITNYYITIPSDNLEIAFWLESDRMLGLNFNNEILRIQKNVVIEEFKQRYLNQPYGDIMLLLKPMAYQTHPYSWMTIGKDISHIEKINLQNVKDFFYSHYAPDNAILTISGNITTHEVLLLAEKWFSPLKRADHADKVMPSEPEQTSARTMFVERDVPSDVIYKAWHVCPRMDDDFYTLDLLTDLLAGGESGRLYSSLVRDKKLFSDINAYLTGEIDPGLMIINGKLMNGVSFEEAEKSINEIISDLKQEMIPEDEMQKLRNKFEASSTFSNTNIQNKAMNLGFCELLGNPDLINKEIELFNRVNSPMVLESAMRYLSDSNCSTLYYKSKEKDK